MSIVHDAHLTGTCKRSPAKPALQPIFHDSEGFFFHDNGTSKISS